MDKFDFKIDCKKCGSTDVRICRHLDFNGGVEDDIEYTGNIVLVCQNCRNRELINLKYEIVL